MDKCHVFTIAFAMLLLPGISIAAEPAAAQERMPRQEQELGIIQSSGYLSAHPDQKFRGLGQQALLKQDAAQAYEYFVRAAHYADKISQAAAAELLWEGEGVTANRPLAYAWMDIAAERGTPLFVAKREYYWRALDPQQQQQAIEVGTALIEEYGDAAAKPRLERVLRQESRRATGSRLGRPTGPMKVCITSGSSNRIGSSIECAQLVEGDVYYQEKFWQPERYWDWQDSILHDLQNIPKVEVGSPLPIKP